MAVATTGLKIMFEIAALGIMRFRPEVLWVVLRVPVE